MNPQLLALLAQKAGTGDVDPLATLLDKEMPGGPPAIAPPPQQPFPLPPQGAGRGGSGVLGAGRPSPLPAAAQAAPQALAAASNQSPLGGGLAPGGAGGGIGANILASLSRLLGGGAGAGSSAGAALPGGPPSGAPAGGGVNPLEALVPPTPGQQQQAPRAIAPRPGGQINPQIMQLILQSLRSGGQHQQPQQSLGSILGGLR